MIPPRKPVDGFGWYKTHFGKKNDGNWLHLNNQNAAEWYILMAKANDLELKEINLYYHPGEISESQIYSYCYSAYQNDWLKGIF